MTSPLLPVEKLRIEHGTEPFDFGKEELNRLLKRLAPANQRAGTSQAYVTIRSGFADNDHLVAVEEKLRANLRS